MLSYIKLIYYLFRPNTVFIQKRSGALGDDLLMSLVLPDIRKLKICVRHRRIIANVCGNN